MSEEQVSQIKKLVEAMDYKAVREMLSDNPSLANEGWPYDQENTTKAHPLHRICDGVMSKTYTDEQAVEMAKIFLKFGADINGNVSKEKSDTPLLAASSLRGDKVAILYIDNGADILWKGCHGGTALHWACWLGRDVVVERLLREKLDINQKCIDFKSTPLFWTVHGWRFGGEKDRGENYIACVKMLLNAGADKTIPNFEGYTIAEMLTEDDIELKKLLL